MDIVTWTLSHEIDLCLCLLLQTQEMTGNLAVNKGEYWCPLCRQLANSVIPIPPEEDQFTIKRPLSSDPKQLIKDVADMMVSRPITPVCTTFRDYSFLIISSLWVEDSSEFFWVCCVHVSVCCLKAFYIIIQLLENPMIIFHQTFHKVSVWRFLMFMQRNMILICPNKESAM